MVGSPNHLKSGPDEVAAFVKSHPAAPGDDDQLMARIRDQRRRAGNRDGFWVKRADGRMVMVFADELRARIPPKGTWKTAEEVIHLMSQVGLRLPGVEDDQVPGRMAWRVRCSC